MRPYTELRDLDEVVLEESYVLGIRAEPAALTLDVDFVLTPKHPEYVSPPPSETECFRRGTLRFAGVQRLTWAKQGTPPAVDASGEQDFGHIDSLEWEEGRFVLSGDWGRLDVEAEGVHVSLTSEEVSRLRDSEFGNDAERVMTIVESGRSQNVPNLRGWDVIAVGRRQAWLFVTFAAPSPKRQERTLWIDNPWRIDGDQPSGEPTLADLERLVALLVEAVEERARELSIRFDDGLLLTIATEPADPDSDGWWFGPAGQ
jgi:hypothetical protein